MSSVSITPTRSALTCAITRGRSTKRRVVSHAASGSESSDPVPPGCARYAVELKKPLGMFLAQDKNGNIFVEELVKDGAAEKSGLIGVGDRLIAVSAIVFNSTMDYGGVSVKKGEEQIRFATRGESFDVVMAAISTWPGARKMKLEFQRCDDDTVS